MIHERTQPLIATYAIALAVAAMFVCAQPAMAQNTVADDATAQPASDPKPRTLKLSGGVDSLSRYNFRGIRQHSTGLATWPWAELAIAAHSGDGALKGVSINLGNWNSRHSGDTGSEGPSGKAWYESDYYASLGLTFGGGVSLTTTYTAYTSPNDSFSTVKEVMVKLAVDDAETLGQDSLKPYVIVAQEFNASPGRGQADGGSKAGTYLEFGVTPGVWGSRASLAIPMKVGLSLINYYEAAGTDNRFGFFSVAGIVTAQLGPAKYGAWNIHGGAEFQKLGVSTKFFNGGEDTKKIFSVGIGFSF